MKKRVGYLVQLIKILYKSDMFFLVSLLAQVIILAIIPFVELFLTKNSITILTTGQDYKGYVILVLCCLIFFVCLNLVNTRLEGINEVKANLIGQKLYAEVLRTCLFMDYESLETKEMQDKKELATQAFDNAALANLTRQFKGIVSSCMIAMGVASVATFADWKLSIISFIIIVANFFLVFRVKRQQYEVDKESVPLARRINYLRDISTDVAVAKEVRIYNMEEAIVGEYNQVYKKLVKALNKMVKARERSAYVSSMGNFLLETAIYVFLGYQVVVSKTMTIADFSMYAVAVRTFSQSMVKMLESFGEIDRNAMHLNDYFEFIQTESKFLDAKKDLITAEKYTFRFEKVGFKYPGSDCYALKDVNLVLRAGDRISIVGENGSGKTTLIKLLMRLYEPTEGKIYINDVDINTIEYRKYLDVFSAVFQDFFIYAFSVKENIGMFHDVSEEKINEILCRLDMYEKINSLNAKLETNLSKVYDENGVELSGGQNQKIAIARAICKDSPVVILDEPTASLDPRAEYELFNEFNNIVQGKTAVYISHRLSSCLFSDCIVVLDKGHVVECGKHDDLLAKNGLYRELFDMQAQYYIR